MACKILSIASIVSYIASLFVYMRIRDIYSSVDVLKISLFDMYWLFFVFLVFFTITTAILTHITCRIEVSRHEWAYS